MDGLTNDLIEIIGADGKPHRVPVERVDDFFDGKTGEPISDAAWDEQKARLEQNNDYLIPEEHRE